MGILVLVCYLSKNESNLVHCCTSQPKLFFRKIPLCIHVHIIQTVRQTDYIDSYVLVLQHNLFCDNCHSHVARALNLMRYEGSSSWNMYKLGFWMVFKGKFTRYMMFVIVQENEECTCSM